MIHRIEIIRYLNDYLQIADFNDYCINGIQVEGTSAIYRIVTGVSVSQQLFQAAVDQKAEMIIVHHGLFWKNQPVPFSLTGVMKQRVKLLLDHDINLAAYHLPLDAHAILGNNAQLLKMMGFPQSDVFDVGFLSRLETALTPADLKIKLDQCLPNPSVLFGNISAPVSVLAVVSGGGSGVLEKAALAGANALITGEASEPSIRMAEELGVCLIRAGHYNSERLGPLALTDHLSQHFGLPAQFIDVPNVM